MAAPATRTRSSRATLAAMASIERHLVAIGARVAGQAIGARGDVELAVVALQVGRALGRPRARLAQAEENPPRRGLVEERVPARPDDLPVERALRQILREDEDVGHEIGVDPLEQHAGRGAILVRHHHRIDDEGRDPDDALHALDLLHDVAVFAKVDRVLQDEDVRVHPEHLVAKLLLKTSGDAHHYGERRDPQRDPEDREGRADRDERALLRPEITKGEREGVAHETDLAAL